MADCIAEAENLAAGVSCVAGATAALKYAKGPIWVKLGAAAVLLSCMLWTDSARRTLEECQRRLGRTSEADALNQWGVQLAAEIDYLRSLGVQETAVA